MEKNPVEGVSLGMATRANPDSGLLRREHDISEKTQRGLLDCAKAILHLIVQGYIKDDKWILDKWVRI